MIKLLSIVALFLSYSLAGMGDIVCLNALELKFQENYRYEDKKTNPIFHAVIDMDGNLLMSFAISNEIIILDKQEYKVLASHGQGPGSVTGTHVLGFDEANQLVVDEGISGKVHFFKKESPGKYTFDNFIWKGVGDMKGSSAVVSVDCAYVDNKMFIAGYRSHRISGSNKFKFFWLQAYDTKGKLIQDIYTEEKPYLKNGKRYDHVRAWMFLDVYRDKLFFIRGNSLNVKIISSKRMVVEKEQQLQLPAYYKPMGEDCYIIPGKGHLSKNKFRDLITEWALSYSSMTKMLVHGKHLVIQIRTCNQKMKRFALLFYNAVTFKKEGELFSDDLLLAARDNRFYFYKNGDPYIDEDADTFDIQVFRLEQ